jgi:hypothetical protein
MIQVEPMRTRWYPGIPTPRVLVLVLVWFGVSAVPPSVSAEIPFAVTTVDTARNTGRYTSLVLDQDADPIIAYHDGTFGNLVMARRKLGIWSFETIDRVSFAGFFNSMELDGDGRLHIAYARGSSGDLMYASETPAGWSIETVGDSPFLEGGFVSMTLDSTHNPYISHYDYSNRDLMFATKVIPW